jgi:hypothetical protein
MEPEVSRAREHLREQAAAKSVPELVELVEAGVAELLAAARSITDAQLDQPLPGGEWSAKECVRHIARRNAEVARQVLHAAWTGALPAEDVPAIDGSVSEALAAMREALDSLYVHVLEAEPQGNLSFTWEHRLFGELNWREWLLFIRLHSLDHSRQLAAAAGPPH